MSRLAREQNGWAMVTAVMMIAVMGTIGLAVFAYADEQENQSGIERVRESSFSLSEGALTAQIFRLSRNWPGTAANAHPAQCDESSTSGGCPSAAEISKSYQGKEFAADTTWQTSVRDNGGTAANFYSDDITASQPNWDANADGRMWVRSAATVRGRDRTLVALVRVEEVIEQFPRQVITAGSFATSNSGNKVIVDTRGPSAQPTALAVRCTTRDATCLDYDAGKNQVSPDTTQTGYAGGAALTPEALERFRARARANGTYYDSGCPSDPSGPLVIVESGDCSYTASVGPCCNTASSPGIFIVVNGTLYLGGNLTFYGVVYGVNQQGSSGNVISLGGNATIQGSAAVDGAGRVHAGSNKVNIVYDERAFNGLRSYGAAGIVQNTWRELTGA